MAKKIRVLVAEDHAVVREGIRLILESQPDMEVIGEAADGREALEKTRELHPDVVLMDIGMPEMNGLEATRQIKRSLPETQILALTVHEQGDYLFRMLEAGASGYVLKGAPSSDLLAALRAASRGEVHLHPSLTTRLVGDYVRRLKRGEATDSYDRLTEREKDVLMLLAEGLTNQQIATRLVISASTVETHRIHIMEKLGLRNRTDLIKYAIRHGLIDTTT